MADVMSLGDIESKDAALLNIHRWAIWNCPGEYLGVDSDDDDESFNYGFKEVEGVIHKIYNQNQFGEETGKTPGYNTPPDQEAESAKKNTNTNGYNNNRGTTVSMLYEIEKFRSEWVKGFGKFRREWKPSYMENLQHWLTDEKGRDQFVICDDVFSEVMWNDATQVEAKPVFKQCIFLERFVKWSPLGTYFATVNEVSAALWGGASTFNALRRYAHPEVKLIDFSPDEKYMVTYSSRRLSRPSCSHRVFITIFDVRTGEVMRDFRIKTSADEFGFGGTGAVSCSVVRWGGDKYFARLRKNVIFVYNTVSFCLIGKAIHVQNVKEFSWSPADPIFAVFVPEQGDGNRPARVSLYQIPSREEIRQKNLFSVSDCKLYWQSEGEYLAVKVERYTTRSEFEVFRIKEDDIPIEAFEVENKIIAFAWEPKGQRFAVIHGHGSDSDQNDISFYSMKGKGGKVSQLTTLKQKQANALFWSPSGRFVILARLKGQFEFYYVDEPEIMATSAGFVATDIQWDPTGRYVATWMKCGVTVNIWSFNGKLLYCMHKDFVSQFSWRPRPASLLCPEKEEEILKNLKEKE